MAERGRRYRASVFINCPFDTGYWPLFEALVFTVIACGFRPRCALEELDSGTIRLQKIAGIIRGCGLAVHDLSRVETGGRRALPRFNMPFELGLDVGCRTFGPGFRRKRMLILDAKPFRYQRFISGIAGHDIRMHGKAPGKMIKRVREWLRVASGRLQPGHLDIARSFRGFTRSLPENCKKNGLDRTDLLFVDDVWLARIWIQAEAERA